VRASPDWALLSQGAPGDVADDADKGARGAKDDEAQGDEGDITAGGFGHLGHGVLLRVGGLFPKEQAASHDIIALF
jgi:hypothetical protein